MASFRRTRMYLHVGAALAAQLAVDGKQHGNGLPGTGSNVEQAQRHDDESERGGVQVDGGCHGGADAALGAVGVA